MSDKFRLSASALALATAASLFAGGSAFAQQQAGGGGPSGNAGAAAELEEVVVTGSSIRGVAAVGSNLVSVGQQEVEAIAAINATQLVNTVPAITNSGSAPQGENSYGYYTPTIHSLGGSASNTTLVLIDGMRMVGGGTQYAQTDPNIIPTSAIQRVEVLADGASSVYGSDAVAGVINFIGRSTFNGLEINGKLGFGDSYHSRDVSVVAGQTWDRGGVFIAASHAKQSTVTNADRPFLSLGDYRFKGGTNTNSFACSPASIRTPASGNNIYLSPQATQAVSQIAANAPCNNSIYGAAIPGSQRDNLLMRATVDVTEKLTVTGTMIWNHLYGEREANPGTLNNVTVFGPGSGRTGQINPFFQAPAGEPGATQETINWLNLLTPRGKNSTGNETNQFYGVAEYKLGGEWTATWSNGYGRSRTFNDSENTFCQPCALLAVNGTATTSGSTTSSNIGGQNVIALNTPLTAANALDVWNPPSSNRTSPDTLRKIYGSDSRNIHYNKQFQTKLEFQGPLFALPAGELRMATGAEYVTAQQDVKTVGGGAVGPTTDSSSYVLFNLSRNVYSGYVEFAVPVISPEMNVPLVQEFDLSLSARYDHYSDVGSTTNPKIAANWRPLDFVKLRANWASAFVAPPQFALGDPNLGYQRGAAGAGLSGRVTIPVTFYPEVRLVPGADCTRVTSCDLGLPANQGLSRSFGALLRGAEPQKGQSYSFGSDFDFGAFVPGDLALSLTYFHNKFRGGMNALNFSQIVNSPSLKDHLIICPNACTQEQINAFTRVQQGARLSITVPDKVYFLTDTDQGNNINIDLTGVDYLLNYRMRTETMGTFRFMTSGTIFTQFDEFFGKGGAKFSTLGSSGFNTTFPSIAVRTRTSLGWDLSAFSADMFINWTPRYRNYSSNSVLPVATNGAGPSGGGDPVKADMTLDGTLAYEFQGGPLKGSSVYVNATNILDSDPPFYNGNTEGIGVGAWGFNGLVSNPIGRVISVGFRGRF